MKNRVRRGMAAGVVGMALGAGGCSSVAVVEGGGGAGTTTTGTSTPRPAGWRPIAGANAPSARAEHQAVWTGSRVIVFGGTAKGGLLATGAAYDPATDTWKALPDAPIEGRTQFVMEWSGSRLLVWGGRGTTTYDNGLNEWVTTYHGDGAIFDPGTWSWTPMPASPASPRGYAFSAWSPATGELVIWGGHDDTLTPFHDGAAFDPAKGTWRSFQAPAGVLGRSGGTSVWDGDRLLMIGGADDCPSADTACQAPVAYDPAADHWSALPPLPSAKTPPMHGAIGGRDEQGVPAFWGGGRDYECDLSTEGASLAPSTSQWTGIASPDTATLTFPLRRYPSGWVGGGKLWVWGGISLDTTIDDCKVPTTYRADGAAYDLAHGGWTAIPTQGAPSPRGWATATWMGSEALVFGGRGPDGSAVGDGAIYRPAE